MKLEALKLLDNLRCNLNLTGFLLLRKIISCDQFKDNFIAVTFKGEGEKIKSLRLLKLDAQLISNSKREERRN
jgi:hypothetical protein